MSNNPYNNLQNIPAEHKAGVSNTYGRRLLTASLRNCFQCITGGANGAWSPIIGIYKLGVPLVQIAGSAEYIFRTLKVFSPTTPAIILFLPFGKKILSLPVLISKPLPSDSQRNNRLFSMIGRPGTKGCFLKVVRAYAFTAMDQDDLVPGNLYPGLAFPFRAFAMPVQKAPGCTGYHSTLQ